MTMTPSPRVHPAWIVLGALTVCMLAGSGLRAVFGIYIKPLEAEFGWSRGALSGAAAISLLLLGAVGPFVGRLADRLGPRRVIAWSLLVLAVGSIGSSFVQHLWQIYLTAGVLLAPGAGGGGPTTRPALRGRRVRAAPGRGHRVPAGGRSAGAPTCR